MYQTNQSLKGSNTSLQLETAERTRIENEKEAERQKATEDLEQWKEEQIQLAEQVNITPTYKLESLPKMMSSHIYSLNLKDTF